MDERNNIVYLSLGSNLGDRAENIAAAVSLINDSVGEVFLKSSLYETEGWGGKDLNSFYNSVVCVRTSLEPKYLLKVTQKIERSLGRKQKTVTSYTNREIDIDVLFYNNKIVKTDELTVPHPLLHLRSFVLVPMVEISSQYIHPELNEPVVKLLESLNDSSSCIKLS